MSVLVLMIALGIMLMVVAIALFFWAVNHDQFEDMRTPGILPLLEDEPLSDNSGDQGRTPPPSSPRR